MFKIKDKNKRYEDKWFKSFEDNWASILGGNALLLPFSVPLIAWLVICQCYSALLSGAAHALGGSVVLTFLGILPCAEIYAVGLSGAVWLDKCILFDGNSGVLKRFGEGIRKNAPKYMLFTLIAWLSSALAVITPFSYVYIGNGWLLGAGIVVGAFQALVLIPVCCLAMIECVFYDDPVIKHLSNAFKLYFIRPLRTAGVTALCALPFVICTLLPFIWQLACWVIYSVAGVSFGIIFRLVRGKNFFDFVISKAEKAVNRNGNDIKLKTVRRKDDV